MQFECPQIELDPMRGRKGPPFKVLLPRAHAALHICAKRALHARARTTMFCKQLCHGSDDGNLRQLKFRTVDTTRSLFLH